MVKSWSYEAWTVEQAKQIETDMRRDAMAGRFDKAVYCIPSKGATPGRLVLATELPDGATDVVRFGPHGSRVSMVPYSHLQSLIWQGCRHLPVCPT